MQLWLCDSISIPLLPPFLEHPCHNWNRYGQATAAQMIALIGSICFNRFAAHCFICWDPTMRTRPVLFRSTGCVAWRGGNCMILDVDQLGSCSRCLESYISYTFLATLQADAVLIFSPQDRIRAFSKVSMGGGNWETLHIRRASCCGRKFRIFWGVWNWNFPENQIFLLDLLVVGSACVWTCLQVLQFWSHYRQSHTLRASAQADFTMGTYNESCRYECHPRSVCAGSTVPGWLNKVIKISFY